MILREGNLKSIAYGTKEGITSVNKRLLASEEGITDVCV
jgi:hypothetical protein